MTKAKEGGARPEVKRRSSAVGRCRSGRSESTRELVLCLFKKKTSLTDLAQFKTILRKIVVVEEVSSWNLGPVGEARSPLPSQALLHPAQGLPDWNTSCLN